MIEFTYAWLFFLLPLPLLVMYLLPAKPNQSAALFMPFLSAYSVANTAQSSYSNNTWRTILLFLIWALLLTAAAKPVQTGDLIEQQAQGRDMFLAVDLSGSMEITDMELNGRRVDRLTMVKAVLSEFIAQRQGDRLGLVLFASKAYVQAPLTRDIATVEQLLQEAMIGFAGQQTAIGEALALASKRLMDNPASSRTVILLTDGANNMGMPPLEAAQVAKQANVTVHTIAFGTDGAESGGFFGFFGGSSEDEYDEKTLIAIADMTGGKYFRARNKSELSAIYDTINQLESREHEAPAFRPKTDKFHWPLGLAMLLSLLLFTVQTQTKTEVKDE